MTRKILPIDDLLPQIQEALVHFNCLILQATPGAGKTTRVPPALLKVVQKNILVLEPRRLAAKLSALRVAEELGELCGETVGYQMRYEKKESSKTRLKFITEGLFLRLLLADPNLYSIDCVILDEFHERHLQGDVALMLLRYLQQSSRPDLKIIIMSATLELGGLKEYLPQAKIFVCQTPAFPVTVSYLPHEETLKPLPVKVERAVEGILKKNSSKGDILVFLPGRQEILKCQEALRPLQNSYSFLLYSLTADTPPKEQQEIFSPQLKRKIILCTNVAETSVTIEGVTTVIDTGLAKSANHAHWNGFSTLELKPISKSSCTQRAGRAGRTQPGQCLRLFSQGDFQMRPAFDIPEIERSDLTQTILELSSCLIGNLEKNYLLNLPWFNPPPLNKIEPCFILLQQLGALDKNNMITSLGNQLSQIPLHPRLSRVLEEGRQEKVFAQTLPVVTLLSEGSLFKKNETLEEYTSSDVEFQLEILNHYFREKKLKQSYFYSIDKSQLKKYETALHQFCRLFDVSFSQLFKPFPPDMLTKVLFAGFSDRVCSRRLIEEKLKKKKGEEYNLCMGGGAVLSASSSVSEEPFILALMAEELPSQSSSFSTQIQLCHGIDKNFLLKQNLLSIEQKNEVFWDPQKRTVVSSLRTFYGQLILKEEPVEAQSELVENLLLNELKKAWPLPFESDQSLCYFNTRTELALKKDPSLELEKIDGENFEFFLISLCEGKKSFAQICEKPLLSYIEDYMGYDKIQRLNSLLPTHAVVGRGRKIQIHYEPHQPPFISSRLQDFFGTSQTPTILRGTVPLVVHLLAPNGQSVQVTQDLEGFWERGYKEVKKELSRRYPRHAWPDDPKTAQPPELFKRKK